MGKHEDVFWGDFSGEINGPAQPCSKELIEGTVVSVHQGQGEDFKRHAKVIEPLS